MDNQIDASTAAWFPIAFPVLFIGMWLFVTTLLGVMSGWFALQRRYPKSAEPPLSTFRGTSGSMGGMRVSMGGILSLSPTRTGLRVGIWRLFGPFQRPFEIPWREIRAERRSLLFLPQARLVFGDDAGSLMLSVGLWNRIVEFAPDADRRRIALEPVDGRALIPILTAIWLAATALFGSFIALTSRTGVQHGDPVPLLFCYGMPGVMVAIALLVFWFRQLR